MLISRKNEFLIEQSKIWDEIINRFTELIHQYPDDVRFIVENWDTILSMTLIPPPLLEELALTYGRVLTYEIPYNLIGMIDWINFFVGHELMDDGSPLVIRKERTKSVFLIRNAEIWEDAQQASLTLRDGVEWEKERRKIFTKFLPLHTSPEQQELQSIFKEIINVTI